MNPVPGEESIEAPRSLHGALHRRGPEHLEALLRILLLEVEPDGRGIAPAGLDDVRAGLDIERGLRPADPVLRRRVAGGPARPAHVPHLEEALPRIEPNAIGEDHREGVPPRIELPGPLWLEDGARGMVRGEVVHAVERRLLDEEIVDEELTSDVDGNHFRGGDEIGRPHGLPRQLLDPRRPR